MGKSKSYFIFYKNFSLRRVDYFIGFILNLSNIFRATKSTIVPSSSIKLTLEPHINASLASTRTKTLGTVAPSLAEDPLGPPVSSRVRGLPTRRQLTTYIITRCRRPPPFPSVSGTLGRSSCLNYDLTRLYRHDERVVYQPSRLGWPRYVVDACEWRLHHDSIVVGLPAAIDFTTTSGLQAAEY